jgi:type II secretory pathway pseudopilin PulG
MTLAEILVAMAILAIFTVPIIFTSQKALQSSLQTEEVQKSYEQAQGLLERTISLATEPDNWRLFDETTDGDGDIVDGTAVYQWGYEFDYTRDDSTTAEEQAYDDPRQIRPHNAADEIKFLTEVRAFVTHIDVDPLLDGGGIPTGLSRITVTVYHAADGLVPLPDTTKPQGGKLVEMSTFVRRVGS